MRKRNRHSLWNYCGVFFLLILASQLAHSAAEPPVLREEFLLQWNVSDSSRNQNSNSPCLAATSSNHTASATAVESLCYIGTRQLVITEFAITATDTLSEGSELCLVIPYVGGVAQVALLMVTHYANSCLMETGSMLNSAGDSCMKHSIVDSVPSGSAAASFRVNVTGGACTASESVQYTFKGYYL